MIKKMMCCAVMAVTLLTPLAQSGEIEAAMPENLWMLDLNWYQAAFKIKGNERVRICELSSELEKTRDGITPKKWFNTLMSPRVEFDTNTGRLFVSSRRGPLYNSFMMWFPTKEDCQKYFKL